MWDASKVEYLRWLGHDDVVLIEDNPAACTAAAAAGFRTLRVPQPWNRGAALPKVGTLSDLLNCEDAAADAAVPQVLARPEAHRLPGVPVALTPPCNEQREANDKTSSHLTRPAVAQWPHAPPHRIFEPGTFMVTGATWQKKLVFQSPCLLCFLQDCLLNTLHEYGCAVQAWAVFPNHYHVVFKTENNVEKVRQAISQIHSLTAAEANRIDGCPGRQVWFQFWDSAITIRSSYFARLRYVHENAVHHGLVRNAVDYPWCSAGWLEQRADPAFRKLLATFGLDRIKVYDEFEVGSF